MTATKNIPATAGRGGDAGWGVAPGLDQYFRLAVSMNWRPGPKSAWCTPLVWV